MHRTLHCRSLNGLDRAREGAAGRRLRQLSTRDVCHPGGPRLAGLGRGRADVYVDYLLGSGPMLLGHGHPEVLEAILEQQLPKGHDLLRQQCTAAVELAEEICPRRRSAPSRSATSALGRRGRHVRDASAARAFTGRDRIVKFEGGYHGMSAESLHDVAGADAGLSQLPAGGARFSAGIPQSGPPTSMLIAPVQRLRTTIRVANGRAWRDEIAATHRRAAAADLIPPAPGFLELPCARQCDRHVASVLIFDEVVTGFRLAYGGAQEHYGVVPDLCTLGKIIGGGLPLAAIAGRGEIMAHFDVGKVGVDGFTQQIGTLSGNPLAAAAGLKTMEILRRPGSYERLRHCGRTLMTALEEHLRRPGSTIRSSVIPSCSMLSSPPIRCATIAVSSAMMPQPQNASTGCCGTEIS